MRKETLGFESLGMFQIYTRMMKGRRPDTREVLGVIFPLTPPSMDTSLPENDEMGHDSAMSDDTREVMPRGEG